MPPLCALFRAGARSEGYGNEKGAGWIACPSRGLIEKTETLQY